MTDADVAVVGGGVVGLSTAYHLAQAGYRVEVFEKEDALGRHQSGRNSGVLHPGFNYTPGSLKASLAREGTRRLKAFAAEHDVACREFGVLVAARTADERARLHLLLSQAEANGVEAEVLEGLEAIREKEPHVDGIAGLWCPEAASIDSIAYLEALAAEGRRAGVTIHLGSGVSRIKIDDEVSVTTDDGDRVTAHHLVNAAGVHADRIARAMGVGMDYRIVPFRGEYYELTADARALVAGLLYPTPDPSLPFLGVHFTRTVDDRVLIGPNAVLAFGREAYRRRSIDPPDLLETFAFPGMWRLMASPKMLRVAAGELAKSMSTRRFVGAAQRLIPDLDADDVVPAEAGIRAQVVARDGTLVGDPIVESGRRSTHVLNAVSPGLTTSLPFGEHVAQHVETRIEDTPS